MRYLGKRMKHSFQKAAHKKKLAMVLAGATLFGGCASIKMPGFSDKPETDPHSQTACALPEEKRQVDEINTDYLDLAEEYRNSIFHKQVDKVKELEQSFIDLNVPPDVVQDIKDHALLYAARVSPFFDTLDFSLQNGASLCAVDKNGYGAGEHILFKSDLGYMDALISLNETYRYDVSFLNERHTDIWNMFAHTPLKDDKINEERAVQALDFLYEHNVSLSLVREINTGLNLSKLAHKTEADGILRFLEEKKISYHETYKPDWGFETYNNYFRSVGAPVQKIPVSSHRDIDFRPYDKIDAANYTAPDNQINPTLIVAEYTPFDFSSNKKEEGQRNHIEDTSRVAYGTSLALGARDLSDSVNVLVIKQNPKAGSENDLTTMLRFKENDYLIVSNSIGFNLRDTAEEDYQNGSQYTNVSLGNQELRDFVLYKAAGNEAYDLCLSVDGVPFCMQDSPAENHYKNIVRVGAAHQQESDDLVRDIKAGQYVVHWYSNPRPTFCGVLPYEEDGIYYGTSFSTPAAAAVERQLADIFARSAQSPNGVIHEDILVALSLTAETQNLHDEYTTETVPVSYNIAGLPMTERCGAGVIQPQQAASLLNDMVQWTQDDNAINPTQPRSITASFTVTTPEENKNGQYVYPMTIAESGIVLSVQAGIPFNNGDKGAALLQIGDHPPVPLDMSYSGLTTDFRFMGYELTAGETVNLITTKPIQFPNDFIKGSEWAADPFLKFRSVSHDSPVNKAINMKKQQTPRPGV